MKAVVAAINEMVFMVASPQCTMWATPLPPRVVAAEDADFERRQLFPREHTGGASITCS
jgi:hypothetical protein